MSPKLKYVMIDNCMPVLFGDYFAHKQFSNLGKITSAGFCQIEEIPTPQERRDISSVKMFKVYCFGESVSLGKKSNPEMDSKVIERVLNRQ